MNRCRLRLLPRYKVCLLPLRRSNAWTVRRVSHSDRLCYSPVRGHRCLSFPSLEVSVLQAMHDHVRRVHRFGFL